MYVPLLQIAITFEISWPSIANLANYPVIYIFVCGYGNKARAHQLPVHIRRKTSSSLKSATWPSLSTTYQFEEVALVHTAI
mmetsp:Transcript_2805/g.4695  ORF Transcript_2805/g.4695 Transcript_2805/m.4695 type:complete len:81 (+) Transcript_2805:1703-1945(+)